MPLDPAILGNLAAGQMAALEAAYGDDDVQIGAAITIVEVLRVQARDERGAPTASDSVIRFRFNSGEPFQIIGILEQAKFQLLAGPGVSHEDEE
jgi:hypothetical protein